MIKIVVRGPLKILTITKKKKKKRFHAWTSDDIIHNVIINMEVSCLRRKEPVVILWVNQQERLHFSHLVSSALLVKVFHST